jgi:DNA mismatch endonuclease, patch repair protein
MSHIRSKDTMPEVRLRKKLWHAGFRYRLYYNIPGKPDIVLPRYRIAIFIDGCFWHRCPKCYRKPKSNIKYWTKKIEYNVNKDQMINDKLKGLGWNVIRFWEHEVMKNMDLCIERVKKEALT